MSIQSNGDAGGLRERIEEEMLDTFDEGLRWKSTMSG